MIGNVRGKAGPSGSRQTDFIDSGRQYGGAGITLQRDVRGNSGLSVFHAGRRPSD